jgi:hypothetical protein
MKRRSAEEKAMWVEDWKQSGTSVGTYAKANGLNPVTFRNWTKETAEEPGFVEITSPIPVPIGVAPEILIERGEMRIHIPLGINRNDLRLLIESLGGDL